MGTVRDHLWWVVGEEDVDEDETEPQMTVILAAVFLIFSAQKP